MTARETTLDPRISLRLDGELDDAAWAALCAAHPQLASALQREAALRAAIADLPREALPEPVRAQLSRLPQLTLHPVPRARHSERPRARWTALLAAGIAVAVSGIALIPPAVAPVTTSPRIELTPPPPPQLSPGVRARLSTIPVPDLRLDQITATGVQVTITAERDFGAQHRSVLTIEVLDASGAILRRDNSAPPGAAPAATWTHVLPPLPAGASSLRLDFDGRTSALVAVIY